MNYRGEGSVLGIGHERATINFSWTREEGGREERGYEKFRAAGNEVRSQKGRVHVWTATVICSRIHGHLSAHGPACLLLHRQNSIVPLLTTSISRHPLPTDTQQPVHRRFIHASNRAFIKNLPRYDSRRFLKIIEFPKFSNQLPRWFRKK